VDVTKMPQDSFTGPFAVLGMHEGSVPASEPPDVLEELPDGVGAQFAAFSQSSAGVKHPRGSAGTTSPKPAAIANTLDSRIESISLKRKVQGRPPREAGPAYHHLPTIAAPRVVESTTGTTRAVAFIVAAVAFAVAFAG
jgi:hypothetical protein